MRASGPHPRAGHIVGTQHRLPLFFPATLVPTDGTKPRPRHPRAQHSEGAKLSQRPHPQHPGWQAWPCQGAPLCILSPSTDWDWGWTGPMGWSQAKLGGGRALWQRAPGLTQPGQASNSSSITSSPAAGAGLLLLGWWNSPYLGAGHEPEHQAPAPVAMGLSLERVPSALWVSVPSKRGRAGVARQHCLRTPVPRASAGSVLGWPRMRAMPKPQTRPAHHVASSLHPSPHRETLPTSTSLCVPAHRDTLRGPASRDRAVGAGRRFPAVPHTYACSQR